MACICRFKAFYSRLNINTRPLVQRTLDRRTAALTTIMQALGMYRFCPVQAILAVVQGRPWKGLSCLLISNFFWSSTVHLIYYISCHLLSFSLIYFTVIYCLYIIYWLFYSCLYAILYLLFTVLFIYVFIFCIVILCFLFILLSLKHLFSCLFIS